MTVISKVGYKPIVKECMESPQLCSLNEITCIIPVKDNQDGIDNFLKEFFKHCRERHLPAEIIIVDNNSTIEICIQNDYPIPVRVVKCSKLGPASARNYGATLCNTQWIHFADSDCIPTLSMLTGYLSAAIGSVGYAGNIKALLKGKFSEYYDSQEILIPTKVYEDFKAVPDYLITANCLVWKPAFDKVGGFNESIAIAGGEDIDLGFKLRTIGKLSYAFESLALHNFEESMFSFRERFRRYGKGNKMISELYDLDLAPTLFLPNQRKLFNYFLAFMQYLSLKGGYNQQQ